MLFEYIKIAGNKFSIPCHSNNDYCHVLKVTSMVALFFLLLYKAEVLVENAACLVSSSLNRGFKTSKLQISGEWGVALLEGRLLL